MKIKRLALCCALATGLGMSGAAMAGKALKTFDHLKNDVTLTHNQYQAAKAMCLHTVHAHKDQLGDHGAMRLLAQCSYGKFDFVLAEIGVDPQQKMENVAGDKGEELIAEWERQAREAVGYIDTIEAAKSGAETKERGDKGAQE